MLGTTHLLDNTQTPTPLPLSLLLAMIPHQLVMLLLPKAGILRLRLQHKLGIHHQLSRHRVDIPLLLQLMGTLHKLGIHLIQPQVTLKRPLQSPLSQFLPISRSSMTWFKSLQVIRYMESYDQVVS